MAEFVVTFIAGASYGLTTVLLGQPLDTIKVRMQGMPSTGRQTSWTVGKELFLKEGIKGLYRGGLPLVVGGSLMRSAQFGVSGRVKYWMEEHPNLAPQGRLLGGLVNPQVLLAGIAGGIGRGIVEIPTDFFKTRKQVEKTWTWSHVFDGTGITLLRNTVLYTAFMMYIDLSKQACQSGYVPTILLDESQMGLTPFAKGAICANMAWLTVWPADVVKTQQQSGNYDSKKGIMTFFHENWKSGRFFRGVIPGLVRSTVANGSSMVVYETVHKTLTKQFDLQRRDMT